MCCLCYVATQFGEVEPVPRNLTAAVYYHNASASRGNPTAQKSLAFFYDTGKAVPVNRALVRTTRPRFMISPRLLV